ncbi:hypothetical protein [Zhihengliuella flava]|uniref:Uncharacterized protein n=1 Tax=Zhihengliuella flava TaxID=1285193 RepID=A0A931DCJ8_9MICC|nr:hypothetical protein [Zhihengliuella flava]MBG6084941.1 hypothetical protein [Zhihengliuella flava]
MLEFIIAAIFVAPFAVPCLLYGLSAWRGRRRKWALQEPAAMIFTKRNVLPLQIGVAGALMVLGVPALTSTLMGAEVADDLWFWTVIVAFPVLMYTHFWWPDVALPAWYKAWLRRGGVTVDDQGHEHAAPLWGPDEPRPDKER